MEQSFFDYLFYGDDAKGFVKTAAHVGGWFALGAIAGPTVWRVIKDAAKSASSNAPQPTQATQLTTQPVQVIRDGAVVSQY